MLVFCIAFSFRLLCFRDVVRDTPAIRVDQTALDILGRL
jgi:hypothetical protein